MEIPAKLSLVLLAAVFGSVLPAQQPVATPPSNAAKPSGQASVDQQKAGAKGPVQTETDQKMILVPADSDQVTVRWLLRIDKVPEEGDLQAGLLVMGQEPNWLERPTIDLVPSQNVQKSEGGYTASLKIGRLVPFGDGKFPLFYKGRQLEQVQVSKPGLVARQAIGDAFVAREGEEFLFVLHNPSSFKYASVRARLRFEGEDSCVFAAEQFGVEQGATTTTSLIPAQTGNDICGSNSQWTTLDIQQYAQNTVRVNPPHSWFIDADSGYARSAKRKGWLTLRFQPAKQQPQIPAESEQIYEQNLPIEVQFGPSVKSLSRGFLKVAGLLVMGALLSLLLRVSVPNFKRKRQLHYQLNEAAKSILAISAEADSNLRVLLGVERRALDQIREEVWGSGPAMQTPRSVLNRVCRSSKSGLKPCNFWMRP